MLKIAVFVSGGGTNLQAIIDAIQSSVISNASIELIVSDRDDVYALERGKKCGIHGIVVKKKDYDTIEEFSESLIERLEEKKIDLIVLAGYLTIVPKLLIQHYENRIINVHPSLIPAFSGKGYYGLKVHEGVLERGVKITGATVHFVDEGTDTGPIILQKTVHVLSTDTAEILQRRVMEEAEWLILPEAIDHIANNRIQLLNNQVHIIV